MGLGLGSLFLASILVLNGLAILNEERFLKRIGWGYEENLQEPPSFKKQVINLLYAVRVLLRGARAPLPRAPRGRARAALRRARAPAHPPSRLAHARSASPAPRPQRAHDPAQAADGVARTLPRARAVRNLARARACCRGGSGHASEGERPALQAPDRVTSAGAARDCQTSRIYGRALPHAYAPRTRSIGHPQSQRRRPDRPPS